MIWKLRPSTCAARVTINACDLGLLLGTRTSNSGICCGFPGMCIRIRRGSVAGLSGHLKERIAHLQAYRWSSYPSYIGRSKPLGFVDYAPILNMVEESAGGGRNGYRRYVDSGLAETDEEFKGVLKASPCCIGNEGFRLWVERWRGHGLSKRKQKQDVAFRRVIEPLKTTAVLDVLGQIFAVKTPAFSERRRNSALRAVAARCLIRFSGQTQRAAAERLGLGTGAAVSAQMKQLPALLAQNRSLKRLVDRADKELEQLRFKNSRHSSK
jgi:hypothetical protein